MKRPEEVTLSREDGEALIERLEKDALTAEDRRVLVKVLTFYFWLLFALREAQLRTAGQNPLQLQEKLRNFLESQLLRKLIPRFCLKVLTYR